MRARHPALLVLGAAALATVSIVAASQWISLARELPAAPAPPIDREPDDAGAPASFIAFAQDFRGFRGWERHAIEGAMRPMGAPEGPSFVYANRPPPRGVQRWPVGTVLVKTVESGAPSEWTIHAMVKRGNPYNVDGAVGWEYFELRLAEGTDEPAIAWRGRGPPSGHGYAARGRDAGPDPVPLVCNDCHAAAWRNDGVLTPALSIR